jgi:hypothetical protein
VAWLAGVENTTCPGRKLSSANLWRVERAYFFGSMLWISTFGAQEEVELLVRAFWIPRSAVLSRAEVFVVLRQFRLVAGRVFTTSWSSFFGSDSLSGGFLESN